MKHQNADLSPSEKDGSSNSHPHPEIPLVWEVGEHGIDTFSLAWRPKGDQVDVLLAALATGHKDPSTGKLAYRVERAKASEWFSRSLNGLQVGCFPQHNVIVVEGRLAAALAKSETASGLRLPTDLDKGLAASLDVLALVGVDPECAEVVRRVDLTGELLFPDAPHGSIFLRAFAGAVSPPRYKSSVIWSADNTRVETAYWMTPQRGVAKGRFYDAGVKHKTHAPGQRLRLEHQIRYPKARQDSISAFLSEDLGKLFCGALNAWIDRADNVFVLSPPAAMSYVLGMAERNELSAARAERLLGTLFVLEQGTDGKLWTARKRSDRLSELRSLGIALELNASKGTQAVGIYKPLEALRAAWQQ